MKQTESDPVRTTLLPPFYFWLAPQSALDTAHSRLMASQLICPPPPFTQLTPSHSCGPTLTLPWVSVHSEIPGRNSVVQSVRSLCRDFWHHLSHEPPLGFEPKPLRFSESAVHHSTHRTTRVLLRWMQTESDSGRTTPTLIPFGGFTLSFYELCLFTLCVLIYYSDSSFVAVTRGLH